MTSVNVRIIRIQASMACLDVFQTTSVASVLEKNLFVTAKHFVYWKDCQIAFDFPVAVVTAKATAISCLDTVNLEHLHV